MSKEAIKKVAEGRVWTGEKAKKLGLVDELGGIDKALDFAVKKAKLSAYTVLTYPEKKSFFSSLLETNPGNYIRLHLLSGKAGELYQQFNLINNFDKCDRIQARVPFELNID